MNADLIAENSLGSSAEFHTAASHRGLGLVQQQDQCLRGLNILQRPHQEHLVGPGIGNRLKW